MDYILYLLLPCLGLSIIVVVIEIMGPIFKRSREKEIKKARTKWFSLLTNEKQNSKTKKKFISYINKPSYLIAFNEILDQAERQKCIELLAINSKEVCNSLSKQKDNVLCGYFAHVLSTIDLSKTSDETKENYANLMLSFSKRKSVYCHENALKVFYVFGNPEYIIKSYEFFTERNIHHNEKLLSDGLCSFSGDKMELAKALLDTKQNFDIHYQIATVNFLTISGIHDFDSILTKELTDELDVDYKCAILRLISKVKSNINKSILLATLQDYGFSIKWQPAAVAANGLALYQDDTSIMKELAKACSSQHWSVRINSANSLAKIDTKKNYVNLVLHGDDAFAKDAISYALSSEIMEK